MNFNIIFIIYGSFPGTSAMEPRGDSPTSTTVVVSFESSNQNWKAHFAALAFTGARIRRGNKREPVFVKRVQRAAADVMFASFALETLLSKTSFEMSLRELSMCSEIFHVEIFNKYSYSNFTLSQWLKQYEVQLLWVKYITCFYFVNCDLIGESCWMRTI